MKKTISLLLALVLCLSLCACRQGSLSPEEQVYAQIVEMLEQGDYDGAHAAIDALAQENGWDVSHEEPTFYEEAEPPEAIPTETVETKSEETVFYIHNAQELFSIVDDAEHTYILANDIDLNGQAGTIPSFSGVFDGDGKVIFNAASTLIADNYGSVQNLSMESCNIQLTDNAAAIATTNYGTIMGCSVSGTISSTAENAYAGGIVCENRGIIEACVNNADISAESYSLNELGNVIHGLWAVAGGITADNDGTISRCVNNGAVSSKDADYISASGGIVGGNTSGEIANCYNTGAIASDNYDCGGIVGFSDYGKFINCYNIGKARSGIAGDNRDYLIDCYYLKGVSSNGSGSGLNPEGERLHKFSQEDLYQESTFSTFDFETIWIMTEDGPQLR